MNCARATPYQKEIMRHLWKTGETDSRTTHNHLQTTPHPILATTDATIIVSSTPWGKRARQARNAGIYKPRFIKQIEKTRRTNPLTYRMEYEAEFTEEADTWLTQDLLAINCARCACET